MDRGRQSRRWAPRDMAAGAFLWIAALLAGYQLFGVGALKWAAVQPETIDLLGKTVCIFLFLLFMLHKVDRRTALLGILVFVLVFSYAYQVILPLAAVCLYLFYASQLGKTFRKWCRVSVSAPFLADSLAGYSILIVVFAGMSMLGVGSIPLLQGFVLVSGSFLFLYILRKRKTAGWRMFEESLIFEKNPVFMKEQMSAGRTVKREKNRAVHVIASDQYTAFCLALMGTMLFLELGRMNISLDFDSLWYGVRAEYILDNGGGIYENLGTMGVVYTYPKGLEILTLPLANLPSHSFLACFGICFAVMIFYTSYLTAKELMDTKTALLVPTLISVMPSIMNLTISVKTDTITLLFQMIMMYYLICYLKHQKLQDFLLAFAALLFGWTLKPTGLLFSSAVFGMSFLYFLCHRMFPVEQQKMQKNRYRRAREKMGIWIFCFPAVAALGVVCVRTLLITGVPFTSIFTGIFTKLGFTLRYPFNVESVPFSAALLSTEEKLLRVGKRTLQLIFCPIDQADMAHVVCAWGGPVIVLMAVFALIGSGCFGKRRWRSGKLHRAETCGVRNRKTAGDGRWYFLWILIPLTLANLLSFWQLKQIDGNYYNFYYVLLLLAGCRMASSQVQNENVQTRKDHVQILKRKYAAAGFTSRHLLALALPVLLLDFALCAVSSTSWQVGFSPVSWGNYRGYYPHEELERQTMAENGNSQIWEILAEDETNRVIVIGEHPSRLAFPCNTQSYYDVAGSWGNKNLVKDLEHFVPFLEFAQTDYFYIQADWMMTESESYRLVKELTAQGILTDFLFEEGNILARVEMKHPEADQAAREENLVRIQEEYPFYEE